MTLINTQVIVIVYYNHKLTTLIVLDNWHSYLFFIHNYNVNPPLCYQLQDYYFYQTTRIAGGSNFGEIIRYLSVLHFSCVP